ncbi:MAG: hypothetical protein V7L21_35840 [Nostoc sp.]|uniref:hypothetical protein n=1 Tax=Nostoc sp. TaxID=1180 RepID=UPI002FFBFB9A
MTQILGTLKDSGGNTITGKLVVSLTGTLIDDTTNPDTIYLPQSYTFTITAGALDITLPQSETSRITYNFQFFKTNIDGSLIEPALINFNALVPNVSPVQFATLTPTGITNDVLDTGALRTARLIATTPALAQNIGGPFPQGAYSPTTTYKFRDLVTYLNRTYISKDINPITGVEPTVTASWMVIPVEPNGSLILADDAPYSSAWNGSGKSASQDAVYDQIEDIKSNIVSKANLISPIFSGDVIVPNQTVGDASTKAANTNFVAAGLAANLISPSLTGVPTAPTATVGTNTTQVATTAFVQGLLASPMFTGDPKSVNPAQFDRDTSIATTSFAQELCRPAFFVISNSPQTNTVQVTITYGSEYFDLGNVFTSNQFGVTTTGYYMFGGGAYLVNNDSSNSRRLGINYFKSGSIYLQAMEHIYQPGEGVFKPFATIVAPLSAGDSFYTVITNYSSGSSFSAAANLCYFWGIRLPI